MLEAHSQKDEVVELRFFRTLRCKSSAYHTKLLFTYCLKLINCIEHADIRLKFEKALRAVRLIFCQRRCFAARLQVCGKLIADSEFDAHVQVRSMS